MFVHIVDLILTINCLLFRITNVQIVQIIVNFVNQERLLNCKR